MNSDQNSEGFANILIVEDEALVAEELKVSLTTQGYHVSGITGTAEEAITLTATQHPDLVMMDIRLGGRQDGIDAALAIRKNSGTPVVFVSAFSDEQTLTRARTAEPAGYLVKPFREDELHAAIEMALYKIRQRELECQAETLFEAVFNASTDAVVIMDETSCILRSNVAAERLFKRKASEIVGQLFPSFFTPDLSGNPSYVRVFQSLATPAGSVNGQRVDMTGVRADGSNFPAEMTMLKTKHQDQPLFAAFVRDVTERKRIEEELNKLVANLIRNTPLRKPFPDLVPVCASCTKARNETGEWVRIERYLSDHMKISFTHGYCQECATRLLNSLPGKGGASLGKSLTASSPVDPG